MPSTHHAIELPERYRVLRHIAAGGMATVWAARDELLGREVAVKVIAPHIAPDDQARARFAREARAAARVSDHPNVVTIYDVGEHGGRAFLVMEHLGGGSLAERLRAGAPIPRAVALGWLKEAAAALDAAHAHGVVHRDVKPANLLLDTKGRLAVADFGIARLASEAGVTTTGEVLGTAAYLSPEQATGEAATPASDRYSLAVVAYELLTGSRPFVAEHAAAQARLHVEQPPPRATAAAPDLPPAVDDVLEKGLAKDPAQRWPTAVAFVEALERAVGDAATTPVTMGTTELTERLPPVPVPVAVPAPAAGAARRASPPPAPRAPRPPAGPSGPPPARRDGRGWRPLAVLGIFALALVGLAIALAGGGDDDPERASTTRASDPTTPRARTQPANTTPTSSTPARSPATGSPAQLNDRGYDLMRAGRYAEAIPLLEQAVAAYPEDSNDLTYAYALYNLGRSLRLAGRPADAIPYLERRLRFDNQRDVVQAELDAARREAGVAPGNGKVKKNKEKAGDD